MKKRKIELGIFIILLSFIFGFALKQGKVINAKDNLNNKEDNSVKITSGEQDRFDQKIILGNIEDGNELQVSVDQKNVTPELKQISGNANPSSNYKFFLTYQDQAGQIHSKEPIQVSYDQPLIRNLKGNKWSAMLPIDLNHSADSLTLEVEDESGLNKSFNLLLNNWWEINGDTLTIHPHELNFDQDKVTYFDFTDFQYVDGWPWTNELLSNDNPKKIIIEDGVTVAPNTSLERLFLGHSVTEIMGLEKLDTHQVTNMSKMFRSYSGETLDLSNFNTNKVTDMNSMFASCYRLKDIDISRFQTDNVTDMSKMFYLCSELDTIDVSHFNTSKVTDMSDMFKICHKLTTIDVSNFDTSNVTDMHGMFYQNSFFKINDEIDSPKLQNINVSNFNTSKVTNMSGMFRGCVNVATIDVSNFDTSNVVDMSNMFNLNRYEVESKLTSLDVSNFNTSKVTNMQGMFGDCERLTSLDVSGFNTSNVNDMSLMFYGCESLKSIDVTHFNTIKVTNMQGMFQKCETLKEIDFTSFDTSNVTDMSSMFYSCASLTSLDLTTFNTSNVTTMFRMFSYCKNLITLDVSTFNTSKVIDMSRMFEVCYSLEDFHIANFNTSNVTNMTYMFFSCTSLKLIDVSNFDTKNVVDMRSMFDGCTSLLALEVTNFDTSKVKDMMYMFNRCSSLKMLDVSNFNSPNLYSMRKMFADCTSLLTLTLGRIVIKNDPTYTAILSDVFNNCSSLTSLDLSNLDTTLINKPGTMEGMLMSTPALWKITLGPKTKLDQDFMNNNDEITSIYFPTPVPGTKINDIDEPMGNYYATERKWQEVGTGTPHLPNGPEKTANEIIADSQANPSKSRTYVWYQTGKLSLKAPNFIDFGTQKFPTDSKVFTSSEQSVSVTDNRNFRINKQWELSVSSTNLKKIDDPRKTIPGNSLYIQNENGNHQLSSTGQVLYQGMSSGINYKEEWKKPWNLLFIKGRNQIPELGEYRGKLIFTLVDMTP